MPFRDPVPFLILPPGINPDDLPIVGQTAILLNPGPPDPIIEFFTGDSDEGSPGFIQGASGGGVLPAGSLWLWLSAPVRDDSGNVSSIVLKTGGDAVPGAAEIGIDTVTLDVDADVSIRTGNDLDVVGGSARIRSNPVPYRVGTQEQTANSGNITTTETIIATLTVALITGGTYRIRLATFIDTSIAGDDGNVKIREDNASGTILNQVAFDIASASIPKDLNLEAEYTAVANGNKTLVATLVRIAGTGNLIRQASATQPTYFYVDYKRGL